MLNILPDMTCRSPQESLNVYDGNGIPPGQFVILFDQLIYRQGVYPLDR